ncbi:MAG: glycosyltransferase family 2 protein [Azoarcus sp.]|jgi:predicted LPLAT superfamily acyltransferase|nr:glycosyltransferase family 2 protein [Azoarcus sp.]
MKKTKTVAIVPVYNHGETVGDVVATLRGYGLPVILVDDGSDARTAKTLEKVAAEKSAFGPGIKLVRLPKNRGKGAAVMTGFRAARLWGATHALQVDADGQHGLEVVPRFLEASKNNPDAVISGYPLYDVTVPRARLYGRYFTHLWVWINTLSTRIKDTMCGFRLYPLAAVMAIQPALSHALRMEFDTEIAVRLDWAGVPFINLPIAVRYPPGGRSHFRVLRDNVRIAAMHARLFFGMLWRLPKLVSRLFPREEQNIHWARIGEAGFMSGMRILLWIYRHGGVWLFRAILVFVVFWYFLIRGIARRASLEYLEHLYAVSGGLTPAPNLWNSYRHFVSFGETILDKLVAMDFRESVQEPYRYEGEEAFHRVVDEGRGVLVIAAHFGNLELCRRFHREHRGRVKLTLLAHVRNAKRFQQFLSIAHPGQELDVIPADNINVSTAMLLSERISAGGIVVITGDRVPVSSDEATVPVPFLGQTAYFPVGPYVLAAALGCPVFMMFSARTHKGVSITVRKLSDRIVLPRRGRNEAVQPWVEAFASALAQECVKNPLQWFNFYPFWQVPADKGIVKKQ